MKAAKMYGKNDIRIEDCEIPEIGSGEILLKVKAAAICGTDLRMIKNGAQGIDEEHPRILGHEVSGIIEKTGKDVRGYEEGMHISLAPNIGCGVCDACVQGNPHLCREYQAFGINMDGGFAEYMKIPEEAVRQGNLKILDKSVDFAQAAVFEPASCVLNGQSRLHIGLGDSVLIIGAGPIGMIHAMMAKAYGAGRIYIRDLAEERMKLCTELDQDLIPVSGPDLAGEIRKLTGGRGMDVCIVACPSGKAQADVLEITGMNGRILFFGGLPQGKDQVEFQSNLIHYKQLSIFGSTRANTAQYRTVAEMAEQGKLNLKGVITRTYPLAQFQEAVEYASGGAGLKTVIVF